MLIKNDKFEIDVSWEELFDLGITDEESFQAFLGKLVAITYIERTIGFEIKEEKK